MQPKTSIITSLFLWLALVSAAVNLAQIVASNEDLEEQSTNADNDVNNVAVLNGLTASQKQTNTNNPKTVTQDLAGINSALVTVIANAQQVTPTPDGGYESSATSSFSSNYSLALQTITVDQADKENIDDATGSALGQIGSAVSAYA
ncbi:hypothetical protein BDR22DRAFT_822030 [Usnea florida]